MKRRKQSVPTASMTALNQTRPDVTQSRMFRESVHANMSGRQSQINPQDLHRFRSKNLSSTTLLDAHLKPPCEGQKNKAIQAIVSPPIRSKAALGDRSDFVDAMVDYLRTSSMESSERLYRAAKKLMFKAVATDPKAAEILARTGKDRDLMIYLLNRIQESGLDVSPVAWERVRSCLLNARWAAVSIKSSLAHSMRGSKAGFMTMTKSDMSLIRDHDDEGSHDSEKENHYNNANNARKNDSTSCSSKSQEHSQSVDVNNAHKDMSITVSDQTDEGSSSSSSSGKSLPLQESRTASGTLSRRESQVQKVEKIKSKLDQFEANWIATRSDSSISDKIKGIRERLQHISSSQSMSKADRDEDEDCGVIWDDESSSEDRESSEIARLVQDIQDVFQDGTADFLLSPAETVNDNIFDQWDDSSDGDVSMDVGWYDGEAESDNFNGDEREEIFKSEFRESARDDLLPLDKDDEVWSDIFHVEVDYDANGKEIKRLEFNKDGRLSRQVEYDDVRRTFIRRTFDESGKETRCVDLDLNGKEVVKEEEDGDDADGGGGRLAGVIISRDFLDGTRERRLSFEQRGVDRSSKSRKSKKGSLQSPQTSKIVGRNSKITGLGARRSASTLNLTLDVSDQDNVVRPSMSQEFSRREYEKWRRRENDGINLTDADTDPNLALGSSSEDVINRFSTVNSMIKKKLKQRAHMKMRKTKEAMRTLSSMSVEDENTVRLEAYSSDTRRESEATGESVDVDVDRQRKGSRDKRRLSPGMIRDSFQTAQQEEVKVAGSTIGIGSASAKNNRRTTKPVDREAVNKYMSSHGVYDLLQFMMSTLVTKQPDKPIDFLIDMTGKINRNLKIRHSMASSMNKRASRS